MRGAKQKRNHGAFALVLIGAVALLLAAATSAAAAPALRLSSLSNTTAPPGDGDPSTAEHTFELEVANVGDEAVDSSTQPVELSVELPSQIGIVEASSPLFGFTWSCTGLVQGAHSFTCTYTGGTIDPPVQNFRPILLDVSVDPGAAGILTASFSVSGGGSSDSTVDPVRISPTPPPFGLDAFDSQTIADPSGEPFTQAGGHPYAVVTSFDLNTVTNPEPSKGRAWPVEPARDVVVSAPAGLLGNVAAFGQCTGAQLANGTTLNAEPECPTTSQIGSVALRINGFAGLHSLFGPVPLFNMVPPAGAPARFGFQYGGTTVTVDARLRSESDYGIDFLSRRISEGVSLAGFESTFWGVPTDPRHDIDRACSGKTAFWQSGQNCPTDLVQPAFVRMPTSCTAPGEGLRWAIHTDSWFNPGAEFAAGIPDLSDPAWDSMAIESHDAPGYPLSPEANDPAMRWGDPQGTTGCDGVPVKGKLSAQPTALEAETSSGLEVHIEVPNPGLEAQEGIASSDIKGVKVTLPQGITVNPSQAEGLGTCSPARYESTELSFHPDGQHGCPADSKIGTVAVKTPLLEETLPGNVYIATPHENPFNSLLALYIVIEEPQRGILIKLPGEVRTNEVTGRIETEFKDLPQQPFSSFDFKFREGARAPLITPSHCGTYATEAEFTPWSNPNQVLRSESTFQITKGIGGAPCPPGGVPEFNPGFSAGSVNNNAGSFSEFVMRLTRSDGEQDLTKFSSVLPPGVSAKIAGVGKCPEAAIATAKGKTGLQERANPSCPANSQIGRSLAGAGVGSVLTYVPGQLYLAGPYNGAPLSVVSVTPAVAGPFDVGTVVVREALSLDPRTAEVRVDGDRSDPIPHILKGIPLKLRDLRVYVDRDKFTINPTSCDPSSVKATLFGSYLDVFSAADDVPVALSDRYQAAGCASLGFKPALAIKLKGGTKRGNHPALRAVVTPRKGDANIDGAVVTLPKSAFLDQGHIRTICTRVQFAADNCPAGAVYGKVKAWSPLLDEPLAGPVYLRSSNHTLPDLVFDLHGVVDIEVPGRIDSVNGGIRATFANVPDAPISRVVLDMQGGRKGLIVNSANLCAAKNRAKAFLTGQNGKRWEFRPVVKAQCGKKRKRGGTRK